MGIAYADVLLNLVKSLLRLYDVNVPHAVVAYNSTVPMQVVAAASDDQEQDCDDTD